MSQADVETLRSGYETVNRRDWDAALRDADPHAGRDRFEAGSVRGECFNAVQTDEGAWTVLDRRHRGLVGSVSESHERAEGRAAALKAASARQRVEGRQLTMVGRDKIDAGME